MNREDYMIHYDLINNVFEILKIKEKIEPLTDTNDYDKQMRNLYEKFKEYLIRVNPKNKVIIYDCNVAPDMGLIHILKNMNENPDNLKYNF